MQMAIRTGADQVITDIATGHAGSRANGVIAELTEPARWLFARQRAARCTCSPSKRFFGPFNHSIVGAQSFAGTGLAFANRYRKRRSGLADPISAINRQSGARSARASTWRSCGSFRGLHHRERNRFMRWAPQWRARRHQTDFSKRGASSGLSSRRSIGAGDGTGALTRSPYGLGTAFIALYGSGRAASGTGRRRCAPGMIRSSRSARASSRNWASEEDQKAIDAGGSRDHQSFRRFRAEQPRAGCRRALWTDIVR